MPLCSMPSAEDQRGGRRVARELTRRLDSVQPPPRGRAQNRASEENQLFRGMAESGSF